MAADLSLLKSATADILGLQGTAAEETANATAKGIEATGATAEEAAYQTAGNIALSQSDQEAIIGNIQKLQEQRNALKTLGSAAASTAANGFSGDSETSLAIMRSNLQQSYLGQQLIDAQTGLTRTGYLEQSTATQAEIAAVKAQANAATSLQNAETTAAATASSNAANETSALKALLAQINSPNNPDNQNLTPQQLAEQQATQGVITSTLASPLNGPAQLPQVAQPSAQPGVVGPQGTAGSAFNTGIPTTFPSAIQQSRGF